MIIQDKPKEQRNKAGILVIICSPVDHQTLIANMPDGASTVTSTTPGESDTTRITTEVLATYFVVAAVILGSLLFIGVRKLAQLCCFSNIFNRPNTDAEDKTYNPHTPVPGLLYQLQVCEVCVCTRAVCAYEHVCVYEHMCICIYIKTLLHCCMRSAHIFL